MTTKHEDDYIKYEFTNDDYEQELHDMAGDLEGPIWT